MRPKGTTIRDHITRVVLLEVREELSLKEEILR